jgi:hypothetical protein
VPAGCGGSQVALALLLVACSPVWKSGVVDFVENSDIDVWSKAVEGGEEVRCSGWTCPWVWVLVTE